MHKSAKAAAAAFILSLTSSASAGILDLIKNDPIDVVKEGVLSDYSQTMPVGKALEHYYDCQDGTAQWDFFETDQGKKVVDFQCVLGEEHRTYLMQPEIKTKAEAVLEMMNMALSLFSAENGDDADPSYEDAAGNWQQVKLEVQFAINLVDESKFELDYVGLMPTYADGLIGDIPLLFGALDAVFLNRNIFIEDLRTYEDQNEGFGDLLKDVITARKEAYEP